MLSRFKLQPKTKLNGTDAFFLFIILCFSFASRLWILHNPDAVVFDEVHFGNFTNWYTKSEFFYDIHPPLGKMVMFLFANLSEYDGDIDFSGNYARSFRNSQYVILRLTPAIFSSLCAPMIYLALRFDSFSSYAAFISAFLMCCDSSLLTEQRFILSDGMLHFFSCLFLVVFSYTNSLPSFSSRWFLFIFLSGVTLGAACSSKNTAWGLMAYAAYVEVFITLQIYAPFSFDAVFSVAVRGCLLALPVIVVYVLSFVIHFIILPFSGQGTAYLCQDMKDQLILKNIASSELWAKRVMKPNLISRTILLSFNMHRGNMGIKQFHGAQSRPINWPLLTGNYVAFWVGSQNRQVNCMGNVFVYYFAFFSLIANFVTFWKPKWNISLRYVVGRIVSFVPFFLIPRSMFLYHYLIPLIIGCMSAGAAVDNLFSRKWVGIMLVVVCVLSAFGFYLWSPYAYGTSHLDRDITIWHDNWVHGDQFHRELQKSSK
ncbi:Dolichyl-phosphate-mannose-protein mannosyltransferase [Tritrichomonas foetus]|uniref:Dolichyl-phosphate-mannose-protein mannosyltransferase n=1 Tax=Tritrichomonas foetus TaxID=1144522 RepID=A0A1J4K0X6_9EUKA|nr:Dolichyl-phosphate-mannose-protein mannosyltransferase [Tritrichomonas foetus]|eukprot:OHT04610.1 Dolichyl-phosphate-mannose-protein mannosyltransferase [Tritrichomonas foetus]